MTWVPDLRDAEGPIYLALAKAISQAVFAGKLPEGTQLPTHQELSTILGIDITTVRRAYAEVKREGLIDSDRRRGSFVRHRRGSLRKPAQVLAESGGKLSGPPVPSDISQLEAVGLNMPPSPPGDLLQTAISEGFSAAIDRLGYLPVNYQPSGGMAYDREAWAQMMQSIAPTDPDQIVIAAGAQNALHALCVTLLKPGDRVAAGRFTYPGFLAVVRRIGSEIVPIEMDSEGLIPDAIEAAARQKPIKVLFVVPTNDNPTTATMSEKRRQDVAAIAERHDIIIIEDDAYGGLAGFRHIPIAYFAPTRTWYIVNSSKILAPGFRVATVRAPSVRDAFDLSSDIRETAVMAPPLTVALITQWILNGTMIRFVAAVREESRARQQIALDVLGPGRFVSQPEGYHLWLPRLNGVDSTQAIAAAGAAGLPVVSAAAFVVTPTGLEQSLQIILGGMRTRERLRNDLERLVSLLARSERRYSS